MISEQSSLLLSIVSISIVHFFYHSNYLYGSVPYFNIEWQQLQSHYAEIIYSSCRNFVQGNDTLTNWKMNSIVFKFFYGYRDIAEAAYNHTNAIFLEILLLIVVSICNTLQIYRHSYPSFIAGFLEHTIKCSRVNDT